MPYSHIFLALATNLNYLIIKGGYIVIFLSSIFEGLPLIGMLVPGHVIILSAGFLSKIGLLNVWFVILLSSLGAIIGDYLGFYFGRKYGMSFIDKLRPYFFIKDSHISKTQALLNKHTGTALIVGRFSPITRALMPFMVGCSQAPAKRFWFFNIIGGILWVFSSVLIGYVFGLGYHAIAGFVGRLVLIAIVTSIIIIWGYRFVNERFHIFRRYELFVLTLNIISFFALLKTIEDTWAKQSYMANFDVWVNTFMAEKISPFIASIANIITNIGGTAVMIILALITGLIFLYKRRWRSAAIMIISIGTTGFFVGLMKELFLRVRPENALHVIVNDPSFPSGHAAMAAAFFVAFAYVMAPKIHSRIWRELFIAGSVLAVIIIGLTRLILNVHWFSDVLAGWSLGVFVTTGTILLIRYLWVLIKGHQN
jgi:undecaprenyl-diphosphatase